MNRRRRDEGSTMGLTYLEQTEWMHRAECKGVDSNLFFPSHTKTDTNQAGPGSYKQARVYCDRCPVADECLQFALRMFKHNDEDHGMWGGLSPRERRTYRRTHRRPKVAA